MCFYTVTPFWAGEAPNINNLVSKVNTFSDSLFTNALSKIEFEYENDEIYFAVCKDGLIMTKIKKLDYQKEKIIKRDVKNGNIRFIEEYLKYLNSIQLILSSALLKKEAHGFLQNFIIRTGEAFGLSIGDGGTASGVPRGATSYYFHGRYLCYYRCDLPINVDDRIFMRKPIQEEVFKTCFEDINIVIKDIKAIQILSQLNSALGEYKSLNFRQSLVQSWCIVEWYINKMFNAYLVRRNIKNQDSIRDEIDTAFKKINFLKDKQIILDKESSKMHTIRIKRNGDLHDFFSSDKKVTYNDCTDAFDLITDLVKKEYGLDLQINYGLAFTTL